MNNNTIIGFLIAIFIIIAGVYWISSQDSDNGGFLLDFFKKSNSTEENNATNNTYTKETSPNPVNDTINNTINNTPVDNSTVATIQFLTTAVFDNSTNTSLISVNASEDNITVDSITLFTSYDNINFTEEENRINVSLPTIFTVPVNIPYQGLYYYLEILYNNMTYRVPENGSEVINISRG